MKRFTAYLLGLGLLVIAVSCGKPPDPPTPPEGNTASHPAYLAVLCVDAKKIDIFNLDTQGAFVKSIALPETPGGMSVSPQGDTLVVIGSNCVYSIKTDMLEKVEKHDLTFTPDNIGFGSTKFWVLVNKASNSVIAYNDISKKALKEMATPAGPQSVAFRTNEESAFVYIGCIGSREIMEISLQEKDVLRKLLLPDAPGELLIDSVDKKNLYVSLPAKGQILRVDLDSMTITGTVDLEPGARFMAISSAGNKLYVSLTGTDQKTGSAIASIELPTFKREQPDPIVDERLKAPGELLVYDVSLEKPMLYVVNGRESIAQIDLNSLKVIQLIPVSAGPTNLGFIPAR